ncbi:uncharacterized protein LOC111700678 [Eurytemora carolleeae]|uniref:uncharacterized protein LOC111700678 n=1 Tax=Eurytemora carolleeae TaxID=1294199 RepID=UPI000C7930E6|nr:uncharacterized protein LOC111700678 [Eurytemora carolleeae]|eukprot:XP_023327442.1 uncharacterized protein LOC111700678 [Eurytemora affinis]
MYNVTSLNETSGDGNSDTLPEKNSHLHLYMTGCVVLCWLSCTPNFHFIYRVLRKKILVVSNLITLAFVLANFVSVIATSLDTLRLEHVKIPPVIRLGLFGASLFFIQLEILKQFIHFFFKNKSWLFSVKLSLVWISGALLAGFLLGYFLILLDPRLDQEAPEHNPHAFWRNEAMIYYVILPSIVTLLVCLLILGVMITRILKYLREVHEAVTVPTVGLILDITPDVIELQHGIDNLPKRTPPSQLEEETKRNIDDENPGEEKKRKEEVMKTTIFLSIHIIFFIICLFIC